MFVVQICNTGHALGRMFAATRIGQMPVTLVASLPAGSVLRPWWWEAELLSFHQRSQGKKSKETKGEVLRWWKSLVVGLVLLSHCGPKILKRNFLQISSNTVKGEVMAGAAVAVLSEEELCGNMDIPILCSLWRRLVLHCSCSAG